MGKISKLKKQERERASKAGQYRWPQSCLAIRQEQEENDDHEVNVVVKSEVDSDGPWNSSRDYGDIYDDFGDKVEEEEGLESVNGEEEEETVTKVWNSKREKAKAPSEGCQERNCLLCYCKIRAYRGRQRSNLLEANFNSNFILKKMLSVPSDKMAEFLEKYGNHGEWVRFCENCGGLVEAALEIQREISGLEERLRECQDGMISKIQKTWRQEETAKDFGRPIEETRRLVALRGERHDSNSGDRRSRSRRNRIVPSGFQTGRELDGGSLSVSDFCDENIEDKAKVNDFQDVQPRVIKEGVAVNTVIGDMKVDMDEEVEALHFGQYTCHLCPWLTPMSMNNLADHVMFHYRRPLKCSMCSIYYSNESELAKNVKQVDDAKVPPSVSTSSDNTHACSIETLITATYQPVVHHTSGSEDSIEMKHRCSSCSKGYRTLAEWRLHRAVEHPEVAKFSCKYCDISFKAKTSDGIDYCDEQKLLDHMTTGHQPLFPNKFGITKNKLLDECDFCGTVFSGYSNLNKHMTEFHSLSKSQSYLCPACSERKSNRKYVYVHMDKQHLQPSTNFICDLCGFSPSHRGIRLEDHRFLEHGIQPEEGRAIRNCSKEGCPFQCLEKRRMDMHMMKEHGADRKHKCRFCGKGFLNSGNLNIHEQIHLNADLKPYQCEICGKSFAVQNYLYIHVRLSHENRPFASTHKKKPTRKRKATPSTGGGSIANESTQDEASSLVINDVSFSSVEIDKQTSHLSLSEGDANTLYYQL